MGRIWPNPPPSGVRSMVEAGADDAGGLSTTVAPRSGVSSLSSIVDSGGAERRADGRAGGAAGEAWDARWMFCRRSFIERARGASWANCAGSKARSQGLLSGGRSEIAIVAA